MKFLGMKIVLFSANLSMSLSKKEKRSNLLRGSLHFMRHPSFHDVIHTSMSLFWFVAFHEAPILFMRHLYFSWDFFFFVLFMRHIYFSWDNYTFHETPILFMRHLCFPWYTILFMRHLYFSWVNPRNFILDEMLNFILNGTLNYIF